MAQKESQDWTFRGKNWKCDGLAEQTCPRVGWTKWSGPVTKLTDFSGSGLDFVFKGKTYLRGGVTLLWWSYCFFLIFCGWFTDSEGGIPQKIHGINTGQHFVFCCFLLTISWCLHESYEFSKTTFASDREKWRVNNSAVDRLRVGTVYRDKVRICKYCR